MLIRGGEVIVAGRVHHIDWNRPADGLLEGTLLANAEGGGLTRWLGVDVAGSGAAHFEGELSGSVGAPRVGGQAQFDGLTVNWSKSPAGAVRVDGAVGIDGANVTVGPLMLRFANGGWLKIAGSQGRGRLTLARGRGPLPVSNVDLTVQGGGLGTVRPVAGLSVKDLALNLRVAEVGEDRLRVAGDVRLGHNVFDLQKRGRGRGKEEKQKEDKRRGRRPRDAPSALDRVSIDVRLTGPDDAVKCVSPTRRT